MRHRHAVAHRVQANDVPDHRSVLQTTRGAQHVLVWLRQAHQRLTHLVHRRARVVDRHIQRLHQCVQRRCIVQGQDHMVFHRRDLVRFADWQTPLCDPGQHRHARAERHATQTAAVHTAV